jgi:hypothetical protein
VIVTKNIILIDFKKLKQMIFQLKNGLFYQIFAINGLMCYPSNPNFYFFINPLVLREGTR